jgi:hypothetical protein
VRCPTGYDHTRTGPTARRGLPARLHRVAADDGGWAELEAEAEHLLVRHGPGCIAEAVQDAYDLGHDDPDGIRFVAAQLLEDGHSPCRCGQLVDSTA